MSQSKCVLVVDDDYAILDLVALMLDEEGYCVQTAANGQAALDLLTTQRPQVVLLDLMMPIMDGWSACRAMKGNPTTSDLPVIIMSADRHLKQKAQDLSADRYLSKPFDVTELLNLVAGFYQLEELAARCSLPTQCCELLRSPLMLATLTTAVNARGIENELLARLRWSSDMLAPDQHLRLCFTLPEVEAADFAELASAEHSQPVSHRLTSLSRLVTSPD